MKSIKSTLTALSVGILSFAALSLSANEGNERNVIVQINKISDHHALVDLKVDGNAEVFSLPELEIGESRDITTESGKVIFLSRTEDGLSVSIDGEEIDLPHIGGDMQAHIMKGGFPLHTNSSNDIQVIGDLTDDQIMLIKDAFAAAGVDKEVNFTKGNEMKFFAFGDKGDSSFEFEFDTDSEGNQNTHHWISEEGANVKIIKMGKGEGKMHIKSKVILIETKDDEK